MASRGRYTLNEDALKGRSMGNVGRRITVRVLVALAVAGGLIETGCGLLSVRPDQSSFVQLESLQDSGSAVARVYAAPILGIELIAVHTWLVIKEAHATSFDRWEVLQTSGEPYGHVRHNLMSPTDDMGAGSVYVVAEVIGTEAQAIVEFVDGESPLYSCRNTYVVFPGPNSNTYTQWILDGTAWNVTLPPSAVGKDASPTCP